MQSMNTELLAQVLQQRKEIESHIGSLETVVKDLDQSQSSLPHDEMLILTGETVSMDEEMRAGG